VGKAPAKHFNGPPVKHFNFIYYWIVKCEEVLFILKRWVFL
jgi:hypothetical protein